MKTLLFTTMLLGLLACGANSEIPKKVTREFNSKYKGAKNVSWYFEDGQHKASFEHNDFEKEASFKEDGIWVMTTTFIQPIDLMNCITDFINEEYFEAEIMGAEFIEKKDSETYLVTVDIIEEDAGEEEEDNSKILKESIIMIFDTECEFLGEE